jgi:hypothetical protein
MSGTKHTQAPWSVEDPMGPEDLCIVQANLLPHQWRIIASVHSDDGREEDGIPRFEMEANARLIAAAPDLLASILNSDDAHWTTAMRAAVAKATSPALPEKDSGEPGQEDWNEDYEEEKLRERGS